MRLLFLDSRSQPPPCSPRHGLVHPMHLNCPNSQQGPQLFLPEPVYFLPRGVSRTVGFSIDSASKSIVPVRTLLSAQHFLHVFDILLLRNYTASSLLSSNYLQYLTFGSTTSMMFYVPAGRVLHRTKYDLALRHRSRDLALDTAFPNIVTGWTQQASVANMWHTVLPHNCQSWSPQRCNTSVSRCFSSC